MDLAGLSATSCWAYFEIVCIVTTDSSCAKLSNLSTQEQKMVTGVKKIKFPTPGATKEKELLTMVDSERMLVHYNQDHPGLKNPAQRVTPKVTNHTNKLAIDAGWAGAAVAKDAVTGHTAGMMLLRAKKTTITPDVIDVEVTAPKGLSAPKD
jgi:hypothetical protein